MISLSEAKMKSIFNCT